MSTLLPPPSGSLHPTCSDLVTTLRDALLALMVSDRNAAKMSDDEVLSVIVSTEAKQVPIILERANAVWRARQALRQANAFLDCPNDKLTHGCPP